jgi:hypothetical protein
LHSYEKVEPIYSNLSTIPALEEKELYLLSLEREPRNSQLKDLDQ